MIWEIRNSWRILKWTLEKVSVTSWAGLNSLSIFQSGFHTNSGELLGFIKTENLFLPYFAKISINHEFLCRHTVIQTSLTPIYMCPYDLHKNCSMNECTAMH